MTSRRTILTTIAAATLAFGAIAVAAPSASAARSEDTTTCTVEQRTELRSTITDLKARIAERRLTAEERAAKQAERRAAIADLKAQAREAAGGQTLTDQQRAELKARIAALVAAERQARLDRRTTIEDLKAQLVTAKTSLQACRT